MCPDPNMTTATATTTSEVVPISRATSTIVARDEGMPDKISLREVVEDFSDCDDDAYSQSLGGTGSASSDQNEEKSGKISGQRTTSGTRAQSHSIAHNENVAVVLLRAVLITVLVMSTLGVALAVYHYTKLTETIVFEDQIQDSADKIFESIGSALDLSMGAADSLVVSTVSYATANNMTWPFVTIPNQAVRLSKIRSLTKCMSIQQYQYVTDDTRERWEMYANEHGASWVGDVLEVQSHDPHFKGRKDNSYSASPGINFGVDGATPNNTGPYAPTWQGYPLIPNGVAFNWNAFQHLKLGPSLLEVIQSKKVVISEVINLYDPDVPQSEGIVNRTVEWASRYVGDGEDPSEPLVRFLYPVLDTAADNVTADSTSGNVVAIIAMNFFWRNFLVDILPKKNVGLHVVVSNTCGQAFTYEINGAKARFLGTGDRHEDDFQSYELSADIAHLPAFSGDDRSYTGRPFTDDFCTYSFKVYPSQKMEKAYRSTDPIIFTVAAVAIFLFTSLVFLLYDWLVAVRQEKVMNTAVKTNAIVSSLFPSNVRDRLFNEAAADHSDIEGGGYLQPTKTRLKNFLNDGSRRLDLQHLQDEPEKRLGSPGSPIADLFTETTVLFADIANFTAWSSMRDPGQVFTLLETIYSAFDVLAVRRGVFKVETIGDSYVAVAGLPEPRRDHAVVMAKFARDCLVQFSALTRRLETTLGPDTGDLQLRAGMHSGPTTAGVLRGQKSRFQLFGDTVNTASRMESTGMTNRIQISQATADLLIGAKKFHWLQPREDMVEVKGKGPMQTFWVLPRSKSQSNSSLDKTDESLLQGLDDRTERLVGWNTDVLGRLALQIVRSRKHAPGKRDARSPHNGRKIGRQASFSITGPKQATSQSATMVLEEVKEIIELPDFKTCNQPRRNQNGSSPREDPQELDPNVMSQLRDYVIAIANMYNRNSFHNFMHASHVCMSVAKLLGRIVAPDRILDSTIVATSVNSESGHISSNNSIDDGETLQLHLHDHTYGITSDPLTQFACIFAALIHDVDHPGVPNTQLVKEGHSMARIYNGKSVAEQNSVDLAWRIFMEPRYDDLRQSICPTMDEMRRFRSLVVNSVMATDILDKDLKKLRNERWERAFSGSGRLEEPERVSRNRKATVVIEHLIQASDVAHTMQHWHIYRKWNERLFEEMYRAYATGRSESDPCNFWYEGELSFFDCYIIPLAKKLSDCGVFGVSSDEYLNYALRNREEWERRGKEVVAAMVSKLKDTPTKTPSLSFRSPQSPSQRQKPKSLTIPPSDGQRKKQPSTDLSRWDLLDESSRRNLCTHQDSP